MPDLSYLRAEAKRQGLNLSEDDLAVIEHQLENTKSALARERPKESDGLEPPYRLVTRPTECAGGEVENRHGSTIKDLNK